MSTATLPRRDFLFFRRAEPGPADGESLTKGLIVVASSNFVTGVLGIGAVDCVVALSCEQGISVSTTGVRGRTAAGVLCRDCGGTEDDDAFIG